MASFIEFLVVFDCLNFLEPIYLGKYGDLIT